ncbi:MAG TPA: PD-(D/E)XK nuclease family protein [Candidatus Sulfotelmatobacter sp.]|nr:PD-(D/E)XK nuclease family protein [Candidatus Sulfotelmatobacter sp.]
MEKQPNAIQPLSQSRHADMACQCLYFQKHVIGGLMAETQAAARGTEIHRIFASYISHLAEVGSSTDLEIFDALVKEASSEAREVLEKFRDNHAFDPEKILATELHIQLDQDFHPIEDSDEERTAEYEGTLDLVILHSLTEAEIDDWKSYYQIIDADTFQSKLYPLLLMYLNPSLERVKFVLEFVRYGVSRYVEYTRKDLPWLKELAQRERARQRKLHELAASGERDLKASPGRHCTWCPLLLNGCPVAKTNPYSQMTAEERLRFALWLQEAEKQNTMVLKDLMVERGSVCYHDGNQSEYVADFVPVAKKFYPYGDAVTILDEWFKAHPEERVLREKLTVSGLSSAIKAGKRAELAQKLTDSADVRVETELKIGRVAPLSRRAGAGRGPK